MPKFFFFIIAFIIFVPALILFLRQIFTKEELGETPEKGTLREKQHHIKEEVDTLKTDLNKLEHETNVANLKAQQTIDETNKISEDLKDKQSKINKL